MTFARKNTILLFSLLTVINIIIFLYRDHFIYHKYGTYSSLYSSGIGNWKESLGDYSNAELQEARNILHFSVDTKEQSSRSKILGIGKFLYNRFYRQLGKAQNILATTPLRQYNILSSSDSIKLWCGNFADMFCFFCWSEGVPSRLVEIMNSGNHHVVNECYLSESNEWVMVDLSDNNLLLMDKESNRFENLLHLRDSTPSRLISLQAADSSIVASPFKADFYNKYFGNGNPIFYYYRLNDSAIYRLQEKVKRYFLPVAWYEEVNPSPSGNGAFYLKEIFAVLWVFALFLLLGQIINSKKNRIL